MVREREAKGQRTWSDWEGTDESEESAKGERERERTRDLSEGFAAAKMCAQVRLFFCMYSNMLLQYRQLAEKNSGKWWIHETRHLGSVWPRLWELGRPTEREGKAMSTHRPTPTGVSATIGPATPTVPHQLASVQRLDWQHAPSHTNWRQCNVWTGNTHRPTQTGDSATFGPATRTVPHKLASVQRLDRQPFLPWPAT